MSNPKNASLEKRAHAVLDLAERIVRKQVGAMSTCDYEFTTACAKLLNNDLQYLSKQASARWTARFEHVLNSAHSMRCTVVELEDKERRRCTRRRCDACGKHEHWNGWTVDFAGGWADPSMWSHAQHPVDWQNTWETFIERYRADINCGYTEGELLDCDMGSYFVGETCMKKAKLHFLAATTITELVYDASFALGENVGLEDHHRLMPAALYTVNEEAVEYLMEKKEQLELCIADERRHDHPDLMVDLRFWQAVDQARLDVGSKEELEGALRERTASILDPHQSGHDDDSDDSDDSDDDDCDDDDCDGGEAVPGGGLLAVMAAARSRAAVLEDDEEEDAPVARPPLRKAATGQAPSRASKRQRGITAAASSPRRPKPIATLPTTEEEEEEGDDEDEDVTVASLAPRPPAARHPPTPAEVARNMRIPRADGTPAALGSRRSVLLGLLNVQRELILKREDGLAAQVGSAVVTLQELVELVEKQRGAGGSR